MSVGVTWLASYRDRSYPWYRYPWYRYTAPKKLMRWSIFSYPGFVGHRNPIFHDRTIFWRYLAFIRGILTSIITEKRQSSFNETAHYIGILRFQNWYNQQKRDRANRLFVSSDGKFTRYSEVTQCSDEILCRLYSLKQLQGCVAVRDEWNHSHSRYPQFLIESSSNCHPAHFIMYTLIE